MANGFEKEFMNRISRICKQWGFGEPAGRIWGLLLLKNKPLTQKEIVEESGYSLSLISPNLNILQKFGMVSIVGKQGKKRLYLSTTSFIESFERALKDLMEKDVKPLISLLSSSMAEVKDKKIKKRFNILINEYKETNRFLNIFLRILSTRKTFSVTKLREYLAQKIA